MYQLATWASKCCRNFPKGRWSLAFGGQLMALSTLQHWGSDNGAFSPVGTAGTAVLLNMPSKQALVQRATETSSFKLCSNFCSDVPGGWWIYYELFLIAWRLYKAAGVLCKHGYGGSVDTVGFSVFLIKFCIKVYLKKINALPEDWSKAAPVRRKLAEE